MGFLGGAIKTGDTALLGGPAFSGAAAVPQVFWRGEFFEGEALLQHAGGQGHVAEHEAVAIAGKAERHVEQLPLVHRLPHACVNGMLVVFGLDDRQEVLTL